MDHTEEEVDFLLHALELRGQEKIPRLRVRHRVATRWPSPGAASRSLVSISRRITLTGLDRQQPISGTFIFAVRTSALYTSEKISM